MAFVQLHMWEPVELTVREKRRCKPPFPKPFVLADDAFVLDGEFEAALTIKYHDAAQWATFNDVTKRAVNYYQIARGYWMAERERQVSA